MQSIIQQEIQAADQLGSQRTENTLKFTAN